MFEAFLPEGPPHLSSVDWQKPVVLLPRGVRGQSSESLENYKRNPRKEGSTEGRIPKI